MYTWVFEGTEQQIGSVLADMALNFGDKDLGLTPEDSHLLVNEFGIERFMEFLLYYNKKYAMMHGVQPPESVGPFFGLGVTNNLPLEYHTSEQEPISILRMLEYAAVSGLTIVGTIKLLGFFQGR